MPLSNEELILLAQGLTEALEAVLYAHEKDILVDDDMIQTLYRIHHNAVGLLASQ